MKRIFFIVSMFAVFNVGAQTIPSTNIFNQNPGNGSYPPNTLPPLAQVHVPKIYGDHSPEINLFMRQLTSIKKDIEKKGDSLARAEERLSMFFGSKAVKPDDGSPGSQFYPFAFKMVPPIGGNWSDGRAADYDWYRFKFGDSGKLFHGGKLIKDNGQSNHLTTMFTPPSGAVPPRPAASTPEQPVPSPLPPVQPVAPAPPIKVSVHTWTRISTGGSARTIVMRMVGNFRGIVKPAPARKSSRTVKVNASSQSQARSGSTASRGFFFRGHGTFSMHIRTLPSKSFQRRSLRAGR